MSPSALAAAALAVFRRDLTIFLSYRTRALSVSLAGIVGITIFYYVSRLVRTSVIGSPDDYYGYVTVGLVVLGIVAAALGGPSATLRQEMLTGTFERLVVSPLGALLAVVAMAAFPVALATFSGLVTYGFAVVVFGLPVAWATIGLAVPVGALGVLAFLPFGLALAAATVVTKQAQAAAGLVVTVIALVAGVYFPPSLLPGWIEWLSKVQPLTPLLELMREVVVGGGPDGGGPTDALRLLAFAAVALPLSALLLRRAILAGRRRGTIVEY